MMSRRPYVQSYILHSLSQMVRNISPIHLFPSRSDCYSFPLAAALFLVNYPFFMRSWCLIKICNKFYLITLRILFTCLLGDGWMNGEKLHVNHFWNLKGEPFISDQGCWFVCQCDLHYSKKQTNIIFIFHIFKIMCTFASFSATETSSTNDGIYMSSITQGEHCYLEDRNY